MFDEVKEDSIEENVGVEIRAFLVNKFGVLESEEDILALFELELLSDRGVLLFELNNDVVLVVDLDLEVLILLNELAVLGFFLLKLRNQEENFTILLTKNLSCALEFFLDMLHIHDESFERWNRRIT